MGPEVEADEPAGDAVVATPPGAEASAVGSDRAPMAVVTSEVDGIETAAANGPIEGSMILFELPEAANENRPLQLVVPGDGEPGKAEEQHDRDQQPLHDYGVAPPPVAAPAE